MGHLFSVNSSLAQGSGHMNGMNSMVNEIANDRKLGTYKETMGAPAARTGSLQHLQRTMQNGSSEITTDRQENRRVDNSYMYGMNMEPSEKSKVRTMAPTTVTSSIIGGNFMPRYDSYVIQPAQNERCSETTRAHDKSGYLSTLVTIN